VKGCICRSVAVVSFILCQFLGVNLDQCNCGQCLPIGLVNRQLLLALQKQNCIPNGLYFFKYVFGVACPVWLPLFFCYIFMPSSGPTFHLVFRCSQYSNPRPKTMAQITSPRRSPLGQGASPYQMGCILFFAVCPSPPIVEYLRS